MPHPASSLQVPSSPTRPLRPPQQSAAGVRGLLEGVVCEEAQGQRCDPLHPKRRKGSAATPSIRHSPVPSRHTVRPPPKRTHTPLASPSL
eukprot:180628-Rhodomonas_salina.1